MNYRHAFHAGNFADVLKHVVLAQVITHLKRKETPFRVIDTHAGIGLYDLEADEAIRTGEWRDGIGRLFGPDADPVPATVAPLLEPYLEAVRAENPDGGLRYYPGSPALARRLIRNIDRLVLNELHPEDGRALGRLFDRDKRAKVLALDAWIALKALLPPKERRGVILIDPPFEKTGELERLREGLSAAVKRFAHGVYLLWYPVKDIQAIAKFHRTLATAGIPKLFCAELTIRRPSDRNILNGCGLVILNPPQAVAEALPELTAFLSERLAAGPGGEGRSYWLTRERDL